MARRTSLNPFLVTPGAQAFGVPDPHQFDYIEARVQEGRPEGFRDYDAKRSARTARGASLLEREGVKLHIEQVGREFRIYDDRGNYTMKYALTLPKAMEILEKMLNSQY